MHLPHLPPLDRVAPLIARARQDDIERQLQDQKRRSQLRRLVRAIRGGD